MAQLMPFTPLIDDPMANRIMDVANAIVRPLVTLLFAGAAVWFTASGLISGDFFMGVAGTVIAYWFGQRTGEKQAEKAEKQAEHQVEVIKAQTEAIKDRDEGLPPR